MTEAWSQIECETLVRDYFDMFRSEVGGKSYNKAEHRRALQKLLNHRSDGSIEYKHQNVSAILLEAGYPYIAGYKPAFNYQSLLKTIVLNRLNAIENEIISLASDLSEAAREALPQCNWHEVLDDAPERIHGAVKEITPNYIPVRFNYAEAESRNRKLGESGEEFVLKLEQQRLVEAGRKDLAKEVLWVAKEQGDGAGYDIRSFDERSDTEKFIEVKTTNSGKYQSFLITENEVSFSTASSDKYVLYRLFNFRSAPRLFLLPGDIHQHVHLAPRVYRASF